MHIKLLYRKVLYVFLSLLIVFANTQTAFAASSWSITGAVSAGSRTVVTATKSGYKSAVNIAPTAGRLALKLGKGASWASLVYAAIQALPDLKDIDSLRPNYPAGTVEYSDPTYKYKTYANITGSSVSDISQKLLAYHADADITSKTITYASESQICLKLIRSGGTFNPCYSVTKSVDTSVPSTKSISISSLAPRVFANASAGHKPSQDVVRDTAIEMVVAGDFDANLLAGAVPINDNRPLVPSVPGNQNGNVTPGTDPGLEGATPGTQADAAKAAADAAKAAADAAAQAAKDAQNQAANDAADAQDLINSAADQAAIDAANARAAAAEKAAADSKAVADAAAQAAADAAKAADRAAAQAAAQAAADAKAAQAAAQAAIDAVKAAAEADKAAAQAAADAAVRAADAAKAQAEARAKAAEEAAKAADRAKAEATKPFELPAFCSWATPVCDYMTWVKQEYSGMKEWLTLEAVESVDENVSITETIEDGWQDKVNAGYVSFQSQCPDNVLIPVSLMGASQNLNISYAPFCHFASLIKPAVILGAWISGLLIISGGRGRE